MYPLGDDSYGKLQQHTRGFFSYTKPLEQSRHKILSLLASFYTRRYFCYMFANWLAREGRSVEMWEWWMKTWPTESADAEKLEHTGASYLLARAPWHSGCNFQFHEAQGSCQLHWSCTSRTANGLASEPAGDWAVPVASGGRHDPRCP